MNLEEKALRWKAAVVAAAAAAAAFLGWIGVAVGCFCAAMVLDYLTGSWAAKAHGEWSSRRAREGLRHKLGEIAALCVAALSDVALGVVLSTAAAPLLPEGGWRRGWLTLIVTIWYLFTELGSILENAAKLGAPVPKWMVEGVGRMKRKIDAQETERPRTPGEDGKNG